MHRIQKLPSQGEACDVTNHRVNATLWAECGTASSPLANVLIVDPLADLGWRKCVPAVETPADRRSADLLGMKSAMAMGFLEDLIAERRVSAHSSSNGEVEGPDDHVGQAPRAHDLLRGPRRQADHASRPPPTIVRRQPPSPFSPPPLHRDRLTCAPSPQADTCRVARHLTREFVGKPQAHFH